MLKYEDHAEPTLDVFAAPAGYRLVAAQFTIVCTGDLAYGDLGNQGTKVIDSDGEKYYGKPAEVTIGESMGINISLQPGDKVTGWVAVDVPEAATVTAVTYQMDATGITDERTGRWDLSQP